MPILAAGNNSSVSNRGFTLLETLVVLVILGLTLAMVVPAVSRGLGASLNDVARDVHIALRQARADAVGGQRSVAFVLDLGSHEYRTARGAVKKIPRDFELHVRTAEREMQGKKAGIRFYPDGSSSGGRVGISEAADYVWLEVDWLTGRVQRVEE